MSQTLHIEIEDDVLQVLAEEAALSGEPVEHYAARVLTQRPHHSDDREFITQLNQSEARIAEGTLRPLSTEDKNPANEDISPMDAAQCEARQREILSLLNATPSQWARVQQESTDIADTFYATSEGREELADWRALQGEDFAGYEDERAAA